MLIQQHKEQFISLRNFGNSSGAQVVVQHGAGTVLHNSKNDRCKIFMRSGNINYKGYTLYGYKRA